MRNRERNRFPIEIARVVDGDGFEARVLDGSGRYIAIRLYAIDAPEAPQKYGKQATEYLISLVRQGRRFWADVKNPRDPYERTVAVVYKDGFDAADTLNYAMVREGWAYWYSHFEDGQNELGLREAERTAFMEGKGVWQQPNLERPWDYRNSVQAGEIQHPRKLRADKVTQSQQGGIEKEQRESPNTANYNGWTLLHLAAASGRTKWAKDLINTTADVDVREDYGATPLHLAAWQGHKDITQSLIGAGADVNAQEKAGGTPLHWAANSGHTEIVSMLIDARADVNIDDKCGRTPLYQATQQGIAEIVEALIDAGADINASDKDGLIPLHCASNEGHTETVKMLIAAGANINARSEEGWTPLHRATFEGHKETSLVLVTSGADVDTPYDGWIPLHWASANGHVEIVKALICTSANVNARNKDGLTPLHCAANGGHRDISVMLISAGADVNMRDNRGWIPLNWAISKGHTGTANVLRVKGNRTRDSSGSSPGCLSLVSTVTVVAICVSFIVVSL
ncbi:MAG: ankyrin repeat domain-containing protein [Chloroflexota bacterium]|nr:ankyrin repeat domain-containing protein [Chloroflexota bacterium]